ncbi:uncharacterized protein N0V89_007618 [Didymosphaeria variabile]|uniref:FHA domain-containing protein n=1 Tax=Didymosphaeria variabile TaxID=1932322 RepID=A0A9W9CAY8_9PLEO|nr:uncharacterized protein N0V89_007618 [Didymosphaeria variabile]KAJ4352271.1 hypothetical protein N0V89_007618 [Didymosphaeria variabile]
MFAAVEASYQAVLLGRNRYFCYKAEALKPPIKDVKEWIKSSGRVIMFDLFHSKGESRLSFGSSASNDIIIPGAGITDHQFLLPVDPHSRALTVENISSDRLDVTTHTTIKATDVHINKRRVAPGDTRKLKDRQLGAGVGMLHRFQIITHRGPIGTMLNIRINDFIEALPGPCRGE